MKLNRREFRKILRKHYNKYPDDVFILSVDFDNTLCFSKYPEAGEETPVAEFIRSIQDLNIVIILNTCRSGDSLATAIDWCEEHNIDIDYVNKNESSRLLYYPDCRKIFCHMSIDDTDYNFDYNDFI